jgi:glucose/mannose transport system substrate-binding protein
MGETAMRALLGFTLVSTALAFGPAAAQDKPRAEVMHWWTSGGESAAVKVFADQYSKAGGEWVDTAIALGENARAAAINRIVGGNPPTSSQFNTGRQFDDLVSQGLLNPLDKVAEEGKWKDFLPPAFIDAVSRDGHFYAVPVNVHGQNWMFWSKGALEKAGVAAPPKTWDEFFVTLDKVKAAGLIPVALGGQPWQERSLFNSLLLSTNKDLYLKVYRDKSEEAIKSPEFKKVVETFGRLRDYVDPGSPGRNWNDATGLLIANKAAVQFMGDWMKGEFKAAGQVPDKDYVCVIGIADENLMIGGDVFVFPKTSDESQIKAQTLLATTMLAPDTQVLFNKEKGSMPVRTDVDASSLDSCAQKGLKVLADDSRQVPVIDMLITADLVGAIDDVITDYWNNKSATADEMIERFAATMKSNG